jgi:hypothetical protein
MISLGNCQAISCKKNHDITWWLSGDFSQKQNNTISLSDLLGDFPQKQNNVISPGSY